MVTDRPLGPTFIRMWTIKLTMNNETDLQMKSSISIVLICENFNSNSSMY